MPDRDAVTGNNPPATDAGKPRRRRGKRDKAPLPSAGLPRRSAGAFGPGSRAGGPGQKERPASPSAGLPRRSAGPEARDKRKGQLLLPEDSRRRSAGALPGRRLVCRVIEVRGRDGPGTCSYGHRPGQSWEIGETCPHRLCAWAFNALYPFATVLRFGGSLPWEPEPGRARVSCPDPDNTVVFDLALED